MANVTAAPQSNGNTLLIGLLVVAAIIILYVWYTSKKYRYIAPDVVLELDSTDNRLLAAWYQERSGYVSDPQDIYELASTLLLQVLEIEVPPQQLVIGHNLANSKADTDSKSSGITQHIYLRELVGLSGEIAIVPDARACEALRRKHAGECEDMHDLLHNIIHQKMAVPVARYLRDTMQERWSKIAALHDKTILNTTGTYLYLDNASIPGVLSHAMPTGTQRFNLLCTALEFTTLLNRWPKIATNAAQN